MQFKLTTGNLATLLDVQEDRIRNYVCEGVLRRDGSRTIDKTSAVNYVRNLKNKHAEQYQHYKQILERLEYEF